MVLQKNYEKWQQQCCPFAFKDRTNYFKFVSKNEIFKCILKFIFRQIQRTLCNQDGSIVPILMRYGVSIPLNVGGNIVEMLFLGTLFLCIDTAAFPCSFWGCANTFIFISCLHYDLLNFDRISITEKC